MPESPSAKGFRWSLQVVKVSASVPSAYVAFGSRELATRYAEGLGGTTAVSAAELDATHFTAFDRLPVVYFGAAEDVDLCLRDRTAFPYEMHIARFNTEHGLIRNAA